MVLSEPPKKTAGKGKKKPEVLRRSRLSLIETAPPPPPPQAAVVAVREARAVHPFKARNTDELSFKEKDTIELMQTPDEGGWWQGRAANGKLGWFPSNHVEEVAKPVGSGAGNHRGGGGGTGQRTSMVTDSLLAPPPTSSNERGSTSSGGSDGGGAGVKPATPADAIKACESVGGDPTEWEAWQVRDWLGHLGFGEYGAVWEENDIQGVHLLGLGKDDLRELGVTALGHRMTITKAIAVLNEEFGEV